MSSLQVTLPRSKLVEAVQESLRTLGAAPSASVASSSSGVTPLSGATTPLSSLSDTAAPSSASVTASATAGSGSVGTVLEGEGRSSGHFRRPAAPVAGAALAPALV